MNCEFTHKTTHIFKSMLSHKKGINRKTLPKRFLNRLRKGLDKDKRDELIVQSGMSSSLVEKVLLGLRKNEQIVLLAIELADITSEHRNEMLSLVNKTK